MLEVQLLRLAAGEGQAVDVPTGAEEVEAVPHAAPLRHLPPAHGERQRFGGVDHVLRGGVLLFSAGGQCQQDGQQQDGK